MADDDLIRRHEARTVNLFDVRRAIGGLFLLYGVVLTVLGILASDEDIEQAAGVNVNLWTGLAMLVVAGLFIAWALLRPLASEEPGRGPGDDGERPGGDGGAGAQQGQD